MSQAFGRHSLLEGDCLERLGEVAEGSVQTCVTSPPYFGLRDYGHAGQIGMEPTPDAYVQKLVEVFRAVRRVLRDDGTCWLNLGDSYAGGTYGRKDKSGRWDTASAFLGEAVQTVSRTRSTKGFHAKQLLGIPWRVAFALQADGWYLRQDIIWAKPNPMPESVRDRCTKAHEYLFLLAKRPRYYFDSEAMREPISAGTIKRYGGPHSKRNIPKSASISTGWSTTSGGETTCGARSDATRNRRSVWSITPKPFRGAHFATFPPALVEPCILAGSRPGDTVLDPFNGAGTTGLVAMQRGRNYVGIELNPEYAELSRKRWASHSAQLTLPANPPSIRPCSA